MSIVTSLFAANASDWKPAPRARGKQRRKRPGGGWEYREAEPEKASPIEEGADLNDPLHRRQLADLAEEMGQPVRGASPEQHRFEALKLDGLAGHAIARPGQTASERRQAAIDRMVQTAAADHPDHWDPYHLQGIKVTPAMLNGVADAVEKLNWDFEVLGDQSKYRSTPTMAEGYEAALRAMPSLTAMQYMATIEWLDRAHVIGSYQGSHNQNWTADDWAVATPMPLSVRNDANPGGPSEQEVRQVYSQGHAFKQQVVLYENGDGYTLRRRQRPDGSWMNLGHADVIARAYEKCNDPDFSDEQYANLGQRMHEGQDAATSWRWLSESVAGIAHGGGDAPKPDEIVRLAGLMGIEAQLPARLDGEEDHAYYRRQRAYAERLRQTIRQEYLAGRGGPRPLATWLDHDLRPRAPLGVYRGPQARTNDEVHAKRQQEFEKLPDDARAVYKALIAASDARYDPALAAGDEGRHARERVFGNLVRVLGGSQDVPMTPSVTNALVQAGAAWGRSEHGVSRSPGFSDWMDDGNQRRLGTTEGRQAWNQLRQWFDGVWPDAASEKRWYELWK